jgi:hypothetical protein
VAFNPDGKPVVTASDDNTARLWNATWVTLMRGEILRERVCAEKLIGTAPDLVRSNSRSWGKPTDTLWPNDIPEDLVMVSSFFRTGRTTKTVQEIAREMHTFMKKTEPHPAPFKGGRQQEAKRARKRR